VFGSPTPSSILDDWAAFALSLPLCPSDGYTGHTQVAADEKEQTIELSPFIIDASKDQGYRATSTLAGSRINTTYGIWPRLSPS